jgi:hypothetical protein
MFKKILYIGSGDDLTPLDRFRSSSFVYIDPLPRNEYGYPYYYRGFYRKNFKGNLLSELTEKSFIQTGDENKYSDLYSEINVPDLDSHSITFEREGKQRFRFYLSTGIPENLYDGNGHLNEELMIDISECDTLFVKGHWPREEVMEYVNVPIHFIGAFPTYFPEDERDIDMNHSNNTVISYLINNPEKFSSYSYLNESGELNTFDTYSEFHIYYRECKKGL